MDFAFFSPCHRRVPPGASIFPTTRNIHFGPLWNQNTPEKEIPNLSETLPD